MATTSISKQVSTTDEPICGAGIEMQMQRMDLWTQQGRRVWTELREQL